MKYYIQDTRNYGGNSILFWGKNRSGYVYDIDKAGLYSEEEAIQICTNRKTDIAWPEDYIKNHVQKTCDSQYLDFSKSRFKL